MTEAPTVPVLASRRLQAARLAERGILVLLFASATVATVTTAAIFLTLLTNGFQFFAAVDMAEFLFGTTWAPDFLPRQYGSVPLLKGTIQVAVGASLIGIPLGVGSALYLSEFAGDRTRRVLKPTLELLAGIPSIVFGLLALFVIGPFIQSTFHAPLFTALSASLALGVMVVPIISSISDDALRAVPRELREGALALGATKWEATWKVVLPAARSGITAATILGFSRAIGETMVVTLAAGLVPTMTWDYLEPAQTITSFIANRAGGDLPDGSIQYRSIFAIGAYLFALTFAVNLAAEFILARYRRRFA
ncbi:MAG: phosphate transport system permease protein [Thermoplasmata archaeon]|jgi:phosphate transport system permease protein|nr:phosphate transport system permease protein [Thermoplasmata archaeon]